MVCTKRAMNRIILKICFVILFLILYLIVPHSVTAQLTEADKEGYYADVFIDGGVNLSSNGCSNIPSVARLGLTCGAYAGSDQIAQNRMIVGGVSGQAWDNPNDLNGALLYPDGMPRFRVIYVNGGRSEPHGESLTSLGRQYFLDFFNNGGSYTGTCAGAILACHFDSDLRDSYPNREPNYFHLCPVEVTFTTINSTPIDMNITSGSKLLEYYTYGGDDIIASVYHNGGNFAKTSPTGYSTLATFRNAPKTWVTGKPSVWTWKDPVDTKKGRVVVTGSHPERVSCSNGDERCDLMSAILRYALEGVGNRKPVKTELINHQQVIMTSDEQKIGDKQYHYYRISNLEANVEELRVEIQSSEAYDLDLYVSYGEKPIRLNGYYDYRPDDTGSNEVLSIANPQAGTWYVAVYGDHGIFNGVSYILDAQWGDSADPAVCGNGIVEFGEDCEPSITEQQCAVGTCRAECQCPAYQPFASEYDLNVDNTIDSQDAYSFLPFYSLWQQTGDVDFSTDEYVNSVDFGMLLNAMTVPYIPRNMTFYSSLDDYDHLASPNVGNGGSLVGATFAPGKFVNGLLVDSTGEYGHIPLQDNVDAYSGTIEFWYKMLSTPSGYGRFIADSKPMDPSHVYFGLWRGNSDTIIRFATNSGENKVEWSSVPNVFDGNWHHLKVTYDVSVDNAILYIDGVSQGSRSNTMSTVDLSYNLTIGNNHLGERYIGGIIDDLRIYSVVIP